MEDEEFFESIPQPWHARYRGLLIGLGLLFLAAAIATLASLPFLLKKYRHYEADRLAQAAIEILDELEADEEGDALSKLAGDGPSLQRAYELATQAGQANKDLYLVNLALARTMELADPANAFPYWERVLRFEEAGEEEDRAYTRFAIITGKYDVAEQMLKTHRKHLQTDSEWLYLQAQLQLRLGQHEQSLDSLLEVMELEPEHESALYDYIQVGIRLGSDKHRENGIRHLRELAEEKGEMARTAQKYLVLLPKLDPAVRSEYARRLVDNPEAPLSDRLTAIKALLLLDPDMTRDQAFDEARALIQVEEEEELLSFVRWLNQTSQFEDTLAYLPLSEALSSRDLFLVRIDALAMMEDWEAVRESLRQETLPIEEIYVHLFMTRYYLETGREGRAEKEWQRTLLAANGNERSLWNLVEYAGKLQLHDFKREALKELVDHPATMRKAFEKWIHLEQNLNRTSELVKVYEKMLHYYPEEAEVRNDYAYLSLLLEMRVEESMKIAQALVREQRKERRAYLSYHMTLALAHLRLGSPKEALQTLESLGKMDWKQASPRYRAMAAAILLANGRSTQANRFLDSVEPENLIPEELSLLKEYQREQAKREAEAAEQKREADAKTAKKEDEAKASEASAEKEGDEATAKQATKPAKRVDKAKP